jgi:outer membrane protein assembly factor BamB
MFDIKRATSTKPAVIAILLAIIALSGCMGPMGWPGVVADGDTVFVGSMDGRVVRLELSARLEDKDGNTLSKADGEWVWEPEAEAAGSILNCGAGARFRAGTLYGPPAVGNDTVYIGLQSGKVYAIDAEYGDDVWEEPFETGGNIAGGVAIADDTLFVGSSDGKLYAVDVSSGRAKRGFDPYLTGDQIVSTPVIQDGVVYFGSLDQKLYAIDAATGELKWDKPFKTGGGIGSSPLIVENVLYFGSFDSKFYAVYADTGEPKWEQPFEAGNWFWSEALYHNGIIYACSLDHNVYAIDAESGELASEWHTNPFPTVGKIRSSPAIVGDLLVVASEVDKEKAMVYGIDLENGEEKWQHELKSSILAPISAAGGKVYVNGRLDNTVYVFDGETGRQEWSVSLSDVE